MQAAVATGTGLAAHEAPQSTRSSIIPFRERVTCTIAEACQAVGLGRSKIYELIAEGRLRTMTIGRRRLVDVESLLTLVSAK